MTGCSSLRSKPTVSGQLIVRHCEDAKRSEGERSNLNGFE